MQANNIMINMRRLIDLIEGLNKVVLTREKLITALKQTIQQFIDSGLVRSARDIGNGHCYHFVEAVFNNLGLSPNDDTHDLKTLDMRDFSDDFEADLNAIKKTGEKIPRDIPRKKLAELLGCAQHEWFEFQGMYYDASAPEGKQRWLDLPFFADQIEGLRQEIKADKRIKA